MKTTFHVGYHRTGTSWLQQICFSMHPQVTLISDFREPWRDSLLDYLIRTPAAKFDSRNCKEKLKQRISTGGNYTKDNAIVVSSERLSGHPFSGGYDRFRIAERIQSIGEDVRIICVIRNQAKIMPSIYAQLIMEGYLGSLQSLWDCKCWKTAGFDRSFMNMTFWLADIRPCLGPETFVSYAMK